MDIIGPSQGEVDHSRGNSGIGKAINQDKGAGVPIFQIRIKG